MRVFTSWLLRFLILVPLPLWAQDIFILSGQVQDAPTKQPLPFATIALKGSVIGTSADANGFFSLKVKQNPPFTVLISSV